MKDQLHSAGFVCEVDDDTGDTMNKKIRNAQLAQYNFILGEFFAKWCINLMLFFKHYGLRRPGKFLSLKGEDSEWKNKCLS